MNSTTLPWGIITCIVAAFVAASVQEWFTGQYEVTRKGFRVHVARRWYGTRAWVVLRADADAGAGEDEPDRYQVLGWDQEDTSAPWVRVMNIDNEDAESFWAPVTDFAPEAVRRLRPWIFRYRRLLIPVLFAYKTLPRPADYAQDGA
jgi:hypothetical protein